MTTSATTGKGTTFGIGNGASPTELFPTVAEVTDLQVGGITLNTTDATHTESGDYDDFIATSFQNSDWSISLNYVPGGPAEVALLAALESKAFKNYRVTYANSTYLQATALMTGFVPGGTTKDGKMTATATFKPHGLQTRPDLTP